MAHFAKIVDNTVVEVLVVDNEHEARGEEYLNSIGLDGRWVQTSYNANFGKKFAGIGDTYDASSGNFKPAKPFSSWNFDEELWFWVAPKPYPNDDKSYIWDEEVTDWALR